MMLRRSTRAVHLSTIAWAANLALANCSVQLTPPYDEMADSVRCLRNQAGMIMLGSGSNNRSEIVLP